MARTLHSLIDWFIPAELRRNAEVLERARLFVGSNFYGPPLALVVLACLHHIDSGGDARFWIIFAGIAGYLGYPFALRVTGWFELLTFAGMEQLALIVLYGALCYGGLASPFLPWLIAVPVIALYHIGARPFYRVLVFLVLGAHLVVFYLLCRNGTGPDALPRPGTIAVDILSLFCASVFVATVALYHSGIIAAQRVALEREVEVRRLAEMKLRDAKEEAERANRAKSEFLAKMSHELRTPLNAIIGFSQIIGSERLGPVGLARYAEYGGDIERSGHHLLQIISQILDLAKIETGKLVLREEAFDLLRTVEDAMAAMRPLAAARGLAITLAAGPGATWLYADPRRVKQILLNLLSNAVKFTGTGGRIAVTLDRERGAGVRLRVSDTGIGIPAGDLERVLRPFEQVGTARVNSGGGTGLGLPLARELVLLHGGTLTLSSEPGRGTVVTVMFPEARITEKGETGLETIG